MRIVVTGGAGFIGSHLVDLLLDDPTTEVTVVDDMSSGHRSNLEAAFLSGRVTLIDGSLLSAETLQRISDGQDAVFHLAANGDIRRGATDTDLDMRNGVIATRNVLDMASKTGVSDFVFASSSAVYGSPTILPTPESYGPLRPESLYGAAKLAAEGYVSSYCHTFDMRSWIFRFANIVGSRGARGAPSDFVRQAIDQGKIRMMSDGSPTKNFTHVSDCVRAVVHLWRHARHGKVNIFNVGSTGRVSVRYIAEVVAEVVSGDIGIEPGASAQGWPGDIVDMELNCLAAQDMGWKPRFECSEAIARGVLDVVADARSIDAEGVAETS